MNRSQALKIRNIIRKSVNLLPSSELIETPELIQEWQVGEVFVKVGNKVPDVARKYQGVIYILAKEHTSTNELTPDKSHSLWKKINIFK
jgi:hypothetical protein